MENTLLTTDLKGSGIKLLARGKVRDVYEVDNNILLVATDRLSAFDVVMNQGIPGKGRILTQLSLFWFDLLKDKVENHLVTTDVAKMPTSLHAFKAQLEGRSMLCRKAQIFPVECVVRGYVAGSGWKDYQATGAICGHKLPAGLKQAEKLPKPIFTPSTKAPKGQHDENISFEQSARIVGESNAAKLRDLTLSTYTTASEYAAKRGIIIADTKFEFGLYENRIILCDEVLTPDSSRFWDASKYKTGTSPESFDKQIVRDWLDKQPWNKKAPAPDLPADIIERTRARYAEVVEKLTRK
ncbi:MAG: phosphoribosylaminoimidazolesuccinocarboxamide synthase [Planctomycetes bacterium]|nr:phosphoribosylaminoimidazolesuccinocarboxamide synthase [Planctomycetota bacterium]